MDPGKEIELDPDLERGSKWIWIRPIVVDPGGSDRKMFYFAFLESYFFSWAKACFLSFFS